MVRDKKMLKLITITVAVLFLQEQLCWAYPPQSSPLRPQATAKAGKDIIPAPRTEDPPSKPPTEGKTPLIMTVVDAKAVGRKAAERIIEKVEETPDAVIIIDPTANSVYDGIVEICREAKENGKELNFSKVKFFAANEYVGLSSDHLLSHAKYIEKVFYERLKSIDPALAPKPENIHIPYVKKGEKPEQAASRYEDTLQKAIRETGRRKVDLVVLGVGRAYPEYSKDKRFIGFRGGEVGLNQAGSTQTDRTRVIRLNRNVFLDIKFRFKNLRFQPNFKEDFVSRLPDQAIVLGIANFLESNELLLLATGEGEALVVKEMYEKGPTSNFPVTFLKKHKNVCWIIDQDAGYYLPHIRTPWKVQGSRFEWAKESMLQAVLEVLANNKSLSIEDMTAKHLEDIRVPKEEIFRFNLKEINVIEAIRAYAKQFLSGYIHSEGNDLLPKKGEKVIIFSSHPDDDIIALAAIIKMLVARGCRVSIVYLTSGENAVRDRYGKTRRIYRQLVKEFSDNNRRPPRQDERPILKEKARSKTRVLEAKNAVLKLLGPEDSKNVTQEFLDLPYYKHIGFVGIRPIDNRKDVEVVHKLLDRIEPDYIFYSAEKDPHGTHGLGTEIIARALRRRALSGTAKPSKAPIMCGYRGAWQEWSFYQPEGLVIAPFGSNQMRTKIEAIREHRSQLYPMFPGSDPRRFWHRAWDRNRQTGRILEQLGSLRQLGYTSSQIRYAEVFRLFPYKEFLSGFEEDRLVSVTEDGSEYRLAKEPDGSLSETLRFSPYLKVIDSKRVEETVFMQLLAHSDPEIRQYFLRHSKQKLAQYLAELASSYEGSKDYQRAADYWAMAVIRYLKEGEKDKAIECKSNAVKDMRLDVMKYLQPLQSVKLVESLKKDAELSEALGDDENKSFAARGWALASKQYNLLAQKAELEDEKYYFYEESARSAENAARLDKELGEKETDKNKRLERKKHQAKNWHFAALNWLLAKRYNKALSCAVEAIRLDYELGNKIFKAMDLAIAANSCFSLGRFNEAIRYGRLAIRQNKQLAKSEELDERERLVRKSHLIIDLGLVSNCYFAIERYDKAIKYGKEALDTLEAAELNKYVAGLENIMPIYKTLAHSYYYLNRYDEAAEFAQKGAGLFLKEWNDKRNAGNLLSLAGKNRSLLKEHAKSAECYEGAAVLMEDVGENEYASKDWALAAIGRVILAGSGIDRLENYKKAGYDDKRSAELAEAGGRPEMAVRHYLFATRNFDEALIPDEKKYCEEKAIELLKVLVSEIWRKEPGIVGFQEMLEELEKKHPEIFSIETEKYLQNALRRALHQLREVAEAKTGPLAKTTIVKERKALSVITTQA